MNVSGPLLLLLLTGKKTPTIFTHENIITALTILRICSWVICVPQQPVWSAVGCCQEPYGSLGAWSSALSPALTPLCTTTMAAGVASGGGELLWTTWTCRSSHHTNNKKRNVVFLEHSLAPPVISGAVKFMTTATKRADWLLDARLSPTSLTFSFTITPAPTSRSPAQVRTNQGVRLGAVQLGRLQETPAFTVVSERSVTETSGEIKGTVHPKIKTWRLIYPSRLFEFDVQSFWNWPSTATYNRLVINLIYLQLFWWSLHIFRYFLKKFLCCRKKKIDVS